MDSWTYLGLVIMVLSVAQYVIPVLILYLAYRIGKWFTKNKIQVVERKEDDSNDKT